MKKVFAHKNYKKYSGKYFVTADGKVFNRKSGRELKHHSGGSGNRFVRLSPDLSINVAKLMLLTFNPYAYFKNAIAIHKDRNPENNFIRNLKWGTRKEQSKISMLSETNFNRVREMGRKFGKVNGRKNVRSLIKWIIENRKK